MQLRMIEVLAALAGKSRGLLSVLDQSGLLDSLKGGLGAADILTRFNIIEILSEVSVQVDGTTSLNFRQMKVSYRLWKTNHILLIFTILAWRNDSWKRIFGSFGHLDTVSCRSRG